MIVNIDDFDNPARNREKRIAHVHEGDLLVGHPTGHITCLHLTEIGELVDRTELRLKPYRVKKSSSFCHPIWPPRSLVTRMFAYATPCFAT
jgi:hypothetical protein